MYFAPMTSSLLPAGTQALIFDMDGVIFDNNPYHLTAWLAYSKQMGHPLHPDDFPTRVYGKTNEEIIYQMLGADTPEDIVQQHAEAKEALYRTLFEPHFRLAEGLTALWDTARAQGLKVGLATNAPFSNLDYAWQKAQLAQWIQAAAHAHLVNKPKPAPDIYLKVMEMLQVSPDRVVIFEDSLTGIQAGKAAGATVIGITTTYPREKLAQSADYVIDHFDEVRLSMIQDE